MLTDEQRDTLLNSRPERTVTKDQIDGLIVNQEFIRPGFESTMTICVLTLENGFAVTGISACAHGKNFDAELGQKIAYDNAYRQIWALEGYLLREILHKEELATVKAQAVS